MWSRDSINLHLPTIRGDHPKDNPNGRGLPRSIVAEEAIDLTFLNLEGNILERLLSGESFAEI
ncbi:hypothetical protein N9139_02170 [Akkermansiaceae bacterium]|nr:hypothetical protein [Akkermansiaceae bacterium]